MPITAFLNVDLDLRADTGLEGLLIACEPSVIVLNRTMHEASLELSGEFGKHESLEETLLGFVKLISSLPPNAQAIWSQCQVRRFNIGVQGGTEPHHACFTLSNEVLASLAAIQAEVAFTVYAA
jgi:hypothetical protein